MSAGILEELEELGSWLSAGVLEEEERGVLQCWRRRTDECWNPGVLEEVGRWLSARVLEELGSWLSARKPGWTGSSWGVNRSLWSTVQWECSVQHIEWNLLCNTGCSQI